MKVSAIAKLYARKCMYEGMNFNDVNPKKQDEVRFYIEENGYQINDDGTVTKVINEEAAEEE